MALYVRRDEHAAMGDVHEPVGDADLDGLPGEPHTDLVAATGEADLAVAADLRVVDSAPSSSTTDSNGSTPARRNRSHGATIPMP